MIAGLMTILRKHLLPAENLSKLDCAMNGDNVLGLPPGINRATIKSREMYSHIIIRTPLAGMWLVCRIIFFLHLPSNLNLITASVYNASSS